MNSASYRLHCICTSYFRGGGGGWQVYVETLLYVLWGYIVECIPPYTSTRASPFSRRSVDYAQLHSDNYDPVRQPKWRLIAMPTRIHDPNDLVNWYDRSGVGSFRSVIVPECDRSKVWLFQSVIVPKCDRSRVWSPPVFSLQIDELIPQEPHLEHNKIFTD
jgi:hypothetical protein